MANHEIQMTRNVRMLLLSTTLLLSSLGSGMGGDQTLETDTEALAQMYFALGGPGWQNRRGWSILEEAREQFDDIFDTDGDEALTVEEIKRGLNVNYVGCRFPPCFPTLKVHNPLFVVAEPANRFRLEEFGFFDTEVEALITKATRQRFDPVRGTEKVEGRDKSLDGMVLFKEFFSNLIQSDPCNDNWHGILCSDQGRVIGISLQANHLTGTIPQDIGNLTLLQGLHLGGAGGGGLESNNIIGEIPENIGSLYLLESLSLDHNLLGGHLPAGLGAMDRLTTIDLSHNRFQGPLFDMIRLTGLQELDVSHNRLNGTVETISNLTRALKIDMSYNEFSGDLQAPLVNLPFLRNAYWHGNPKATVQTTLSPLSPYPQPTLATSLGRSSSSTFGPDKSALVDLYQATQGEYWQIKRGWDEALSDPCLSSWYGVFCDDLGRITALELSNNNLTGVIPQSIGQLKKLKSLRLANNILRGGIPQELTELKQLRALILANNNLAGLVPPEIGTLQELEDLDLSKNYFHGLLPAPLTEGSLGRIREYRVSSNQFQGALPPALSRLPGLQILDLTDNRLIGVLPSEYSKMLSLKELRAGHNLLEGRLPETWMEFPRLRIIDLCRNKISGQLPQTWGSGLEKLEVLLLNDNDISGQLPESLFGLPSIKRLGLANNQLDGPLPSHLRRSGPTLEILNLRGNSFTGPLPSSIARLHLLQYLDLSHNKFDGYVPDYFETETTLKALAPDRIRLQGNDFACPIPDFAATLSATCTTRNCPLGWVSDGKKCKQCRPGSYRDAQRMRCSRCPSFLLQERHPEFGIITDESCAVWTQDLPQMADVNLSESNDLSVKCLPCRLARAQGLQILKEEDGRDLAQDPQVRDTGHGELKYNGSSAFSDGSVFTGQWANGAPHGLGALATRYGMYVGEFQGGKKVGRGKFTTQSGDELAGEWRENGRFFDDTGTNWGGALNGKGIARYRANAAVALRAIVTGKLEVDQVGTAGGTYEGEWYDGEWHGNGAFSAANGDVYLGEFFRGLRHGRGMMEYALGGFYKGDWYDGLRDGNGTMYYANGDIYEGGFRRGMRDGWGSMWYWDGRLYEGYWTDGAKHGWGRETEQRTGEVYEGGYVGGMRNGHGVIHYGNGDAYHGFFADDLRHGDGIMHYADPEGLDVGFSLKAGFMFGEPRNLLTPIILSEGVTVTIPREANAEPDDALEYWGQRNTNYQVGDGYAGGG